MNRKIKLLNLAAGAGAGALFILARTLLTSSKKVDANPHEENAQGKSGQTERHDSPTLLLTPEAERPEGQDGAKKPEGEVAKPETPRWTNERWQTMLTAVIAFAAIASSAVAYFQWQVINKQSDLMGTAIEEANLTREIENRAYVLVEGVVFTPPSKPGKHPGVHLNFENVGRTTAIATRISVSRAYLPWQVRGSKTFGTDEIMQVLNNTPGDNTVMSGHHILPGGNLGMAVNTQLVARELKTKDFYIWGRVTYSDVFNKIHATNFCFWNGPYHPTIPSTADALLPCGSNNHLD